MTKTHIDFKLVLTGLLFLGVALGAVVHGFDLRLASHANDGALVLIREQAKSPPATNLVPLLGGTVNDFRRGTLVGVWATGSTVRVGPKKLGGQTGYWIVSPLVLNDGTMVPVNRGWVPEKMSLLMLDSNPPAGVVSVTGYLRRGEPALTNDDVSDKDFARLDIDAMATFFKAGRYPRLAVFAESSQPVDDTTLTPVPPEESLPALTPDRSALWFGFAVLCVGMLVALVVAPSLPARRSASSPAP